jgi:hypothetical protein
VVDAIRSAVWAKRSMNTDFKFVGHPVQAAG